MSCFCKLESVTYEGQRTYSRNRRDGLCQWCKIRDPPRSMEERELVQGLVLRGWSGVVLRGGQAAPGCHLTSSAPREWSTNRSPERNGHGVLARLSVSGGTG